MYLSIAEVAEVGCGRELLPSGAAVGKGDPAWTEGLGSLTKGVAAVEAAVTDCADPLGICIAVAEVGRVGTARRGFGVGEGVEAP
jgi:hypothetical protein